MDIVEQKGGPEVLGMTECVCHDHYHEGSKDKCAACDCKHLPVEPQTFLETQGKNAGKIMAEVRSP